MGGKLLYLSNCATHTAQSRRLLRLSLKGLDAGHVYMRLARMMSTTKTAPLAGKLHAWLEACIQTPVYEARGIASGRLQAASTELIDALQGAHPSQPGALYARAQLERIQNEFWLES